MNVRKRHERLERHRMRRKLYKAIDARLNSNSWRVQRTGQTVRFLLSPRYLARFAARLASRLGLRSYGQASA